MPSEESCPFCGAHLINKDLCHICHAFKIKGYVSREVRSKIKVITAFLSITLVLIASFISFLFSLGIGFYIAGGIFSCLFFLIFNKILLLKEERKGKIVWKRAIITW